MRDTLVLAVIIIGIGLGWSYANRGPESLSPSSSASSADNVSGSAQVSSRPSGISHQGVNNEARNQKRIGTPQGLRKDQKSSGNVEEAEELTSIYSQPVKERSSVNKRSKKSLRIAGVPIEAYAHSQRNAVGLPAMPEKTDNRVRLLLSCVELKKEAWAATDRQECSSILARQKDMADRSGAAFR